MGSKEIWKLEYRMGFCFIGASRQRGPQGRKIECHERVADQIQDEVTVTQVFHFNRDFAFKQLAEAIPDHKVNATLGYEPHVEIPDYIEDPAER